MSPRRVYRSYLLRCWESDEPDPASAPVERFVVERVSDAPGRWVFGDFEQLVAFLRAELLREGAPDECQDE